MSIDVALTHVTEYKYDRFVQLGPQTIRLRPAPHAKASILSYSLKISPQKHFINWQQDAFSNFQARVLVPDKVDFLKVEVDLITKINVYNPFDFFLEDHAKVFPFSYSDSLKQDLSPYLTKLECGSAFKQFIKANTPKAKEDLITFLVNINKAINEEIHYNIRLEPGVQSPDETLKIKSGSCRDMAWLGCQVLRHLGLAARFCSGYLIQLKADVVPLTGPKGPDSDFTDLHAWIEVFLPGAGWIGLDPSSGLFAGEGHIPLSCTPNPSSAAPISGSLDDCNTDFQFNMNVTRINEAPRATKPYTPKQWEEIKQLGKKVDTLANNIDLRLTMGGEPTFVSVDNQSLDEWNIAATGQHKESIAKDLLVTLKEAFAKGALLQFSQGKWYPGEILPRWAYGCYWRKDDEKILNNEDRLNVKAEKTAKTTTKHAQLLLKEIAKSLAISEQYIISAHEDIPYYIWKKQFQQRHPSVTNLSEYELSEDKTTNSILDNLSKTTKGYVLPLAMSALKNKWASCAWEFESRDLFLLPGNSPLGLRLPINQLPYYKEADAEFLQERSFADMQAPLPSRASIKNKINSIHQGIEEKYPPGFIKTALCAEVRDDILFLFLPPLQLIEHFLELMIVIENALDKLDLKVVIEGYPPPSDLRIDSFKVTPDPGVLEINVQPTSSWAQLSHNMSILYDATKKHGLEAEKFMVDGKKVGTGGGNHIVLGAQTPNDSPFLRNPLLLKSMLTFWQNHPSLSYLFASLFIGPTSQSPRIDEARHESLYELEIAFNQIERNNKIPFWQIDRLFRNLLVDITGNTHRSEFCIDKLYCPNGETGRLGLLELRSFEMPPHYQMSSLQYLLIKSLITIFWESPYKAELRRFGSKLHDKFMLPLYLAEDFKDVIRFIQRAGIDIKYEWFVPFIEFRFQKYGEITVDDLQIELRAALEPWPVMGEESNGFGVSRGVDSSVERLQLVVEGAIKSNQVLTCNGFILPLKKFKGNDELHVCGVRFKAWQLYSAYHPNIPVHAPLTFDVYDTEHNRSIGGCKYHVCHPGGRNYETYPINENEAQGRRLSRFENMGHTPGENFKVHEYVPHHDFPLTLDLRRVS